jgi:hypothetical protein
MPDGTLMAAAASCLYCCCSWFRFKTNDNLWLTPAQQESVELLFVVSSGSTEALAAEQARTVLTVSA